MRRAFKGPPKWLVRQIAKMYEVDPMYGVRMVINVGVDGAKWYLLSEGMEGWNVVAHGEYPPEALNDE